MRGTVKQRQKGSWRIRVDAGFKIDPETGTRKRNQVSLTVQGTRREAEAKLADILRDLNRGQFVEASKVTFGEWLDHWLESSIKPPNRRPSTYRAYKAIIKRYLAPALGSIPLQVLKAAKIKKYYTDSGLAPATLSVHHAVISSALKMALIDDLVPRNVASLVVGKPRVKASGDDPLKDCWEADEAKRFLTEACRRDAQTAALFALALDTGARKAELCGLKWADIDLAKGTVSIFKQLLASGHELEFGPTKTGESRTVTISPQTMALLRKHKAHQAEIKMANRTYYADHGLVFAKEWIHAQKNDDRIGDPLRVRSVGQREYASIIKAAGVKYIKFHGLRHTSATLLLKAGVPATVVQRRLGHKRIEVTLNIYAHALPSMQEDAAAKIASLLY